MNKIFVDTSFIIALINERDQYHPQALQLVELYDNSSLVLTDAILLEVSNALTRRYKPQAIEIIQSFIDDPNIKIIHLTSDLFQKAFEPYIRYQDKEWGLVDCLSFVVMREENINEALTFDQHFIQAGFRNVF